jgi:8-oxo-dGTP diphosphatase
VETTPDEQALVEIEEETGLSRDDVELVRKGKQLSTADAELGVRWTVHPYLFHIRDRDKIRIDWEHKEAKWIKPQEISDYQTVPRLRETLERVWR